MHGPTRAAVLSRKRSQRWTLILILYLAIAAATTTSPAQSQYRRLSSCIRDLYLGALTGEDTSSTYSTTKDASGSNLAEKEEKVKEEEEERVISALERIDTSKLGDEVKLYHQPLPKGVFSLTTDISRHIHKIPTGATRTDPNLETNSNSIPDPSDCLGEQPLSNVPRTENNKTIGKNRPVHGQNATLIGKTSFHAGQHHLKYDTTERTLSSDVGSLVQPTISSIGVKSSTTTSFSLTTPWIREYLRKHSKDVLLPVPKEYISDDFNLAQLAPIVERIGLQAIGNETVDITKRLAELQQSPQSSYPIYRLALQLLQSENDGNDDDGMEQATIIQNTMIPPLAIQKATEALFLMIHARFAASPRGLDTLRRILLQAPVFGKCPNTACHDGTALLPFGLESEYSHNGGNARLCQRYCPSCHNLWNYWESKTDGCAWGPSLCHLLLLTHGEELYPTIAAGRKFQPPIRPIKHAVFGFRIHPTSPWGSHASELT